MGRRERVVALMVMVVVSEANWVVDQNAESLWLFRFVELLSHGVWVSAADCAGY